MSEGGESKKGKVKTVSGGRTIVQELEYAENGTYKRYAGYEQLNMGLMDGFSELWRAKIP